jgi:hypothetical protein
VIFLAEKMLTKHRRIYRKELYKYVYGLVYGIKTIRSVSWGNFQPPDVRPILDSPNLQVCLLYNLYLTLIQAKKQKRCPSSRARGLIMLRDSLLKVQTIDILYKLDSASLLVKLKPRIFQRLPPFE